MRSVSILRHLIRWRGISPGGGAATPATRALLPDLAVAPLLIAGLWLCVGFDLHQKQQSAVEAASRETADLAVAASASVGQAVAMVDQMLLSLRADYAAANGAFDLPRWSRVRFGPVPAFRLDLLDPNGRPIASNWSHPATASWATARSAADTEDALIVGTVDPAIDRLSLRFGRQLTGPGGTPAGMAVLSVDPRWLSQVYATLDDGRGFYVLARADGIVLARAPAEALAIGDNLNGIDMAGPLHDGVRRIVGVRRLPDYRLLVAVGQDEARALAAYRAIRTSHLLIAAALTLATLLMGLLLLRHKARLVASQQELYAAVENISQGIVLTDGSGRISLVNRRAIELCRLPYDAPPKAAGALPASETICERNGADGMLLEVRTRDLPGGGALQTFTDITARRQAEADTRRLAHYDPLTGLANRHKLADEMTAALAESARGGPPIALIFLDLDRFKVVNDTLGHAAGDQVLREVAERLRATTGDKELIARLGGDEFVVVQAGPAQPAGSMALAHRLVECVSEPYDIAGHPVTIGTSVGIAVPGPGETMDRLLSNADFALYAAKSAGRGTVRLFDVEMGAQLTSQRVLAQDLRQAIEAGRIEVHYQPIFASATGETVAFEALARWTHEVHGPIPPDRFIPLAEANGLIHGLGQVVLAQACATAATWPDRYRLVVNISPEQIGVGNLAKAVSDHLRQSGLPAQRLELEIAERALIERTEQALAVFRGLHSLGVGVSLDDFGTGYSSLAYLRLFPFDRIKIDGRFVRGLDTDPATGTVVQAILGMGRVMQIKVAADGVENEMQLAILRQQRCSEVQGHFLGRPGPAGTLGRFIVGEPIVRSEPARVLVRQVS